MAIELANYETKAADAIKAFWGNREKIRQNQIETGDVQKGSRSLVVDGKNLDGFLSLILDIVRKNGLRAADIHLTSDLVTLPGYFRPTKKWDLLVVHEGRLVAAIEFKSQVGSFSNNFNNRTEEAIGTASDFWVAYREGAFGSQLAPFLGWLMIVEDTAKSSKPVRNAAPHFPVFPEFQGASYQKRYDILCQKLTKEKYYTAAAVISTSEQAIDDGAYKDLSELTSLKTFVTALAGHVAMEAARSA